MRVFELAKKLKIPSKELLPHLKKMGIKVSNHMSSLEDLDAQKVLNRLKKGKGDDKAAPPVKKATRVLIKRKREALPPQETTETVVVGPVLDSIPAGVDLETPATASAGTREVPPSPPIQEQVSAKTPVVEAEKKPVGVARPPGGPSIEAMTLEEAEKKQKRKLLKTDLFELAKQEISSRFKEKFKKVRRSKRTKDPRWFQYGEDAGGAGGLRGDGHEGAAGRGLTSVEPLEFMKPRRKVIKLSEGLTVKEFSELIGQKVTAVIRKLMEMGSSATVNQPIDMDAALILSESYGVKAVASLSKTEEQLLEEESEGSVESESRPPVVTIMGHVDHGKTSLLDAIREAKVAAGEAGGITQHIGAYSVNVGNRKIVFLDTPGHEAFTAIRARGAQVTDIVVLVVAADDGVMPQTVEAINHSRAADVPILVAINKVDKPGSNPERVKNSLAEYELIPEDWGGKTIFVEVSAKEKTNLDTLLEMILLQADVLELKASPKRLARGVIIEAKIARGRGPVATVLVEDGTLRVGDVFVAGIFSGRVRAMRNDEGQEINEAGPATPVEVIGFPGVPQAGDTFQVVRDERLAREVSESRELKQRNQELATSRAGRPVSLEDLYTQIQEGSVKELNLILRADVQGSAEALKESLEKLSTPAVKLKIIHIGVGAVTESDIMLASASNAIVLGFNIRPEPKAATLGEKERVHIRLYTVIYEAISDIRQAMEGLLEPTYQERTLGRCEVRETFNITKLGTIGGAYVTEGSLSRASAGARVVRDGVVVFEGKLGSLKRFKEDVREVQSGYECGVGIENFNDIKQGDIIEVFVVDEIAGKL